MRGLYRFTEDGIVVGEVENIITTEGKNLIAKYLGGLVPSYAGAIAVGVGTTPATVTDKTLEYEVARSSIAVRNVTGPYAEIYQVSFKAVLPNQLEGVIRESAIISQEFNRYAGSYGDKLLSKFTSGEGWSTVSSSNMTQTYESIGYDVLGNSVRIGGEASRFSATSAASPSISIESSAIQGDFSGYSSADQFALAYSGYYVSAGTSIEVRFYSDVSSYYTITLTPAVNTASIWTYGILKFIKSNFSVAGAPSWSSISKVGVISSTNNASTNFMLDGLSIFDTDYINPDYAMISRSVSANQIVKSAGKTMDVEYFLEFKL